LGFTFQQYYKEVYVNAKKLVSSLLITILLVSCASPVVTVLPTIVSTSTPSPTSTVDVSPTQIEETKVANLLQPYQVQQSNDLLALSWTLGEPVIQTLWFTQNARWWSSEDKQTAQKILNLGMNPGLGIRALHADGITGQGVTVAIIDQSVILEHPEFEGKIIKYRDFGAAEETGKGSMHGPSVTSLLAGKNIGTAPGARVYYAAVPSWFLDAQYYADALDWIIAENEKLPEGEKIRVVSVSSIPSGLWSEYTHQDVWDAAYERALKAGILVLDVTYEHGYTNPCTLDMYEPDNVEKCIPQWNGPTDSPHKRIYVPMAHRSTAIENDEPTFSYQYDGPGGLSWTAPYLSGVLAMGWQVNPTQTSSQLLDLVYASAYVTDDNHAIINPQTFIEMVRLTIDR
jgi:serine protease AprX